jgi:pilus assembly protein FimV
MVEVDEAAEVVGTTPTQAVPQFSGVVEEESLVDTTINWVMDNLQWVLIGLGALVLLLLIPRFFRGREDEGDETNFLDDIKQKNKAEIVDDVETKMNKPLAEDFNDDDLHTDEIDDDSDDVLADLDKSIAFEDEADEVEFNFEEVDETTEVDEDEFDLDGFLNDEAKSSDNMSVTADHSATLAGADFSSGDEGNSSVTADHSETLADMDFGLDEDDDLKDLAEDLTEKGEEAIDEIEEISDSFDLDEEEVSNSTTENSTADDDFNFEDEFDFDLDEELDEIEKAAETEVSNDVVETAESLDEEDEFDDLLDLSDDDESFDIETGEGMDEEIDLGLEGLVDEGDAIDTKLDLAKAYLDMGDTEGAKNLLAEVVAEGTADQASAAKKILDGM